MTGVMTCNSTHDLVPALACDASCKAISCVGVPTKAPTAIFSRRTKNKVEKRISVFIGLEVLFFETTYVREIKNQ
jgi:hypothetical protein